MTQHQVRIDDFFDTIPQACPDCGHPAQHTDQGCAHHDAPLWCEDANAPLDISDNEHDPRGHWHRRKVIPCACPRTDVNPKQPMGYSHTKGSHTSQYRVRAQCSVCGDVGWHTTIEQAKLAAAHHVELMP